jgi:hypothetical protein
MRYVLERFETAIAVPFDMRVLVLGRCAGLGAGGVFIR